MIVVACSAPTGTLEPAPITSLPMQSSLGNAKVSAFWSDDDRYYVLAESDQSANSIAVQQWFRFDTEALTEPSDTDERIAIGKLMADIIPIGGGRVAFPIGSHGRRVYRVWRTGGAANGGKTRILEVRAARSRRRPA